MDTKNIFLILILVVVVIIAVVLIAYAVQRKSNNLPIIPVIPIRPRHRRIGGCAGTRWGCCPDGRTPRTDKHGRNCN
jgi:hypothetical protein